MNDEADGKYPINLFMFITSSLLSLGILFLFINEHNRKMKKPALSEQQEKQLYIIIRVIYFFVALYFLIDAYQALKEMQKEETDPDTLQQQKYQFYSSIAIFIAAIINLQVTNPDIIKFT